MNFRLPLTAAGTFAFALSANAQQADTDAILKAIQGLSSNVQGLSKKVDGLQKDVDKLKGHETFAPAMQAVAGQPAPAPAISTAAPKAKSIPGWLVNVVPGDDENKDAVATFSGPLSDFNFSQHAKVAPGRNEYAYHGTAFFHPPQAGRYAFIITAETTETPYFAFNCSISFNVGDKVIVQGATNLTFDYATKLDKDNIGYLPTQSFSGGADLESVDYKVSFGAFCYSDKNDKGHLLNDKGFQVFQKNKVSIRIKGSDDEAARAFESNELFHVGKAKRP